MRENIKLVPHNVVMLPTNEASSLKLNTIHNHLAYGKDIANIATQPSQYLYITSNEEIKEGDWALNTYGTENSIFKVTKVTKNGYEGKKPNNEYGTYILGKTLIKIVATTNPELHSKWKYSERAKFEMKMLDDSGQPYFSPIPESWKEYTQTGIAKIPSDFIQAYIKAYNEDKPITKVNLEVEYYDGKRLNPTNIPLTPFNHNPDDFPIISAKYRLKLRPDGTVIIHPINKRMFTRGEVSDIILEVIRATRSWYQGTDIKVSPDGSINRITGIEDWFNKNYPD